MNNNIPFPTSATAHVFHGLSSTPRYGIAPYITPKEVFYGVIGLNAAIFGRWFHAQNQEDSMERSRQTKWMSDHFTVSWRNIRAGRYHTLLTSAFSHSDLYHLVVNMTAFYEFAPLAFRLGLGSGHMLVLTAGSAVSASVGLLWDQATRGDASGSRYVQPDGLGASGVVQGIMAALVCMIPEAPVHPLGVPVVLPTWLTFVGFLAWDAWSLAMERVKASGRSGSGGWMREMGKKKTIVGYAAHLAGAAFGGLFYLVALRGRFPGRRILYVR